MRSLLKVQMSMEMAAETRTVLRLTKDLLPRYYAFVVRNRTRERRKLEGSIWKVHPGCALSVEGVGGRISDEEIIDDRRSGIKAGRNVHAATNQPGRFVSRDAIVRHHRG